MKHCLIAALCLASGPALAWTETKDFRGLHVYEASGEGVAVSLVCDPDGAMIPPEHHLTFKIGGQEKAGEYMISAGGKSAKANLDFGTATDADFAAIIDVLKAARTVDVSMDGKHYRIETDQPFSGSCG